MPQFVPPINPEFSVPVEPPKWPKVVGIMSIVWGILLLGCSACGTGFAILGRSMIPAEKSDQFPPAFISPAIMGLTLVGVIFYGVLIAGGALTIARKPAGRVLHLVYAIATLVLFPLGIYFGLQNQAVLDEWMRQNPTSDFAKQQASVGGVGKIIGYVMQAVFGLGYPLFTLVWFGLIKRAPGSMGVPPSEEEVI